MEAMIGRTLETLGRNSVEAGVLVIAVLLAQWLFGKKIAPRWRCALWLLVMARLLLPVSFGSAVSLFNLLPHLENIQPVVAFHPAPQEAKPVANHNSLFVSVGEPAPRINSEALLEAGPNPNRATESAIPSSPANSKAETKQIIADAVPMKISWASVLLATWLAGILFFAGYVLAISARIRRRFANLEPIADAGLLALLSDCRERLGTRSYLSISESPDIATPALYGCLKPRLLLPRGFIDRFSTKELGFILLHELAHVKRRDIWFNWLAAILQIIHWFNPLIWFGFARWRADRELACDALALETAGVGQNQEYGRTILRLLENFTHPMAAPGLVGILEDKRQLRRRMEMIARFQPASRWSVWAVLLVAAMAVGCLTDPQTQRKSGQSANPPAPMATRPLTLDLARFQKPLTTLNGDATVFATITGRQMIDGLPFQIDGRAVLFGRTCSSRTGTSFPESIDGICIGRKFDELHLIHCCAWLDVDGAPLARIRLNYSDGSKYELQILYGSEVRDWTQQPNEEREQVADPDTKICWRAPDPHYPLGGRRLFKSMLRNPYPQKVVDSMDVISTRSLGSYVLVAATVAPRDPSRPITPPLAWIKPQTFDGSLVVHVLDKVTGKPVAGAVAITQLGSDDWPDSAAPFYASASGEGVMRYPLGKTKFISITVEKEGYGSKMMQWQGDSIPDAYTFQLSPATGTIGGVVLDEKGQPVIGAEIRLQNYGSGKPGAVTISSDNLSAHSDEGGHWAIKGIPDGCQDFGVTVKHPDFPQVQFVTEGPVARGFMGKHISSADLVAGKSVLQLAAGYPLNITVRDAAGRPVTNATVFVGFARYANGVIKNNTDAQGWLSLKNLALGENYLTISAPGLAPEFRTVTTAATNAPLDVIMKSGKVIHGRVTDAAGKPVAGAEISYAGLADRNGIFKGSTIEWKTQTDASGEFTWDSAPEKAVNLDISKSGYMALAWVRVETDTTNVISFKLGNPLTIKGSVTDADTGEPVASFKVTPGWPENDGARLQKAQAKSGVAGQYEVHFDHPIIISPTPFAFVFQISAPGYAPVQSRPIKPGEGVVTWDVKLKKAPVTIGRVKTADGKPAAGVAVLLAANQDYLQLTGAQLRNQNYNGESFETDADGHFKLPPQAGDFTLAAASDAGFGLVQKIDFTNDPTLTLQPWGRIEGTLLKNGHPTNGQELYFFAGDVSAQRNVWSQLPVATDAQGHFAFPYVPPGTIRIQLKQPMTGNSWTYQELQSVEVRSGGITNLQINLEGRAVKGQLKRSADLATDLDLSQFNLMLQPDVPQPEEPKGLDLDKIQKWYQDWMKTDAGRKYVESMRKRSQLHVKADGTFGADIVTPGKYKLSGSLWQNGAMQAQIDGIDVVVPESSTNDSEMPFDLGAITVKAVKHLNVGDPAPDFSTQTLDGQPLKLSDFKGKYILLDFWATWCGPCVAETPNMKEAYDTFGKDPRFVIISLSLDPKAGAPQKFVQDKDIQWLQGFLGDWSKDTVTRDYAVFGIPSIFLIGPDGKIIAQNLRGPDIKRAVATALGSQ
jgi:beta-lactamase regulating signal transducer with metallopeptidase domain/peroxiredoxin/protocatechuate 3,4-dioxygenase beta subunit/5-hydroxyisourate hydrolase-like protein (transthyretin family)